MSSQQRSHQERIARTEKAEREAAKARRRKDKIARRAARREEFSPETSPSKLPDHLLSI